MFAIASLAVFLASPPGAHAGQRLAPPPVPPPMHRVLDEPAPNRAFSAMVYGYYAYWAGEVSDLQWDRLTHVAIFDVGLSSSGGLTNTAHWTDVADEAVALGEPYGVRIHLAVTSFDDAVMASVLGDPGRRTTAATGLADLVHAHGAHGVAVDFEGMSSNNLWDLVLFVEELKTLVDEVTVATPAVDWGQAYDYPNLADVSDGLFIMGYDYHWKSGDPGPVSPLAGAAPWSKYALDWSVEDYLATGVPREKLILGLPLYGYSWPSTGTNVPGVATGSASAVVFATALEEAAAHGESWDAPSSTPYYFPDGQRQTWYDDVDSLDEKIGWALGDQNLGGIGFWALNYEGGDPALWDMVGSHTLVDDPDPTPDPDPTGGTSGGGSTGGEPDPDPTGAGTGGGASTGQGGEDTDGDSSGGEDPGSSLPPWQGEDDAGACACRMPGSTGGAGWLLLLAPLARRRRR